ncbi:hypothetical protein ABZ322_21360 [Streptomyces sp. NPDC006129]|uniref:hypothetical protein n=1 Tax=Streptomyces sp. NPDC006129 TaxID=3155348 RepID=UPI0033A65D28
MRAVTLAQLPGSPEVAEVEVPRPEPGEVLVKVAASSVNGFDLGTATGSAHLGTGSMAQYVAVPAAIGIAHRPDGVLVRDAGALGGWRAPPPSPEARRWT